MSIRNYLKVTALMGLVLAGISERAAAQSIITQWNFENLSQAVNNSPAPSTGSGTASSIGMDVYGTPNVGVTSDDIAQGVGGDTGTNGNANLGQIWRVRAQAGANGAANGWSSSASIATQGAVFAVSTVGYNSPINVSFDWYAANQGEANMQLEYTTNGTTWTNVPIVLGSSDTPATILTNSTNPNIVMGSYISGQTSGQGQQWFPGLTALISNTAAFNDPNFAIEMVNASTGTACVSIKGTALNNNSGNWRFDNVTISTGTGSSGGGPGPSTYDLWNATSGTWDLSPSWLIGGTGSNTYFNPGDGAIFPSTSANSIITISPSGIITRAIVIGNSANYTFTGGPIGSSVGALGLTDSGTGFVTLASSNTYIGGTAVSGGTLVAQAGDSSFGSPGSAINVSGGATLQISSSALISGRALTIGAGGGTFYSGLSNSTSGAVAFNGPFTLDGGGNLTLKGAISSSSSSAPFLIASGSTLTVGGPVNADQNFLQSGGTFNGNLVVAGPVRVDFANSIYGGSGEVQLSYSGSVSGNGSDNGSGSGASAWSVLADAGTSSMVSSAGTLTTNVRLNPAGLAHARSDVTNSNFTLATSNAFIVGLGANAPSSNTFAITGNIYGDSDVVLGANAPNGSGNGRVLLSGSNTYAGTTLIAGKGIIALGSNAALPASTDVVFNFPMTGTTNPVLDLNGFSQTINSLESIPQGALGGGTTGTNGTFAITNSGGVGASLTISGSTSPAYPFAGQINDGPSGGTIGLIKQGTGTLGLGGYSTFSGGTTINHGVIQLSNTATDNNGSGLGVGPVNVNDGGVLAGSASGGGATGMVTVLTGGQVWPGGASGGLSLNLQGGLTLNPSSSISYYFGLPNVSQGEIIGGTSGTLGTLTLPGSGHVTINVNDQNAGASGIIPLFTFGTLSNLTFSGSNLTNFTLGTNNLAGTYSFVLDSVARPGQGNSDQIDLYNPHINSPANVSWHTTSGTWNTVAANWINGTPNPNLYKDGDTALFPDNSAPSNATITITGTGVTPGAVIFKNTGTAYTLTGSPIVGNATLTASGAGLVTLASTNSYTGGTVITGGTLVAAAGDGSLGAPSGIVTLDNGATLATTGAGLTSSRAFAIGYGGSGVGGTFDTSGTNSTINSPLSVAGTFTKAGAGTLNLTTGTSTLSDANGGSVLAVTGGTLNVSGALSFGTLGSMYVGVGATLTLSNSADVNQSNGGEISGNLVIANSMRVNFNAGTFANTSGTGQILVQPASGVIISNAGSLNNPTYAGTINSNIVLNSNSLPFTKSDVSQSSISPSGSNTFIVSIAGTKGNVYPLLVTINGVISGNADVNIANTPLGGSGSGNLLLNAQNTYTGATLIDGKGSVVGSGTGSTLILGTSNALPPGTDVMFGGLGGAGAATIDLNGNNQQIASLSSISSSYIIENRGGSNSTLTVSGATTPFYSYSGLISDEISEVALVKAGSNTLTLTGANGYSGGTTVAGGVLLLSNSSSTESPVGGNLTSDGGGSGFVNVTGGTLGGVAWVGSTREAAITLTVSAGATVAPGLPGQAGTLNVHGNTTLQAGSALTFNDVQNGDLLMDDGNSTLNLPGSGSVTINALNLGSSAGTTFFPLVAFSSISGGTSSLTKGGFPPSGASYGLVDNGGTIGVAISFGTAASASLTGGTISWGDAMTTSPSSLVTLTSSTTAANRIRLDGDQAVGKLVINSPNSDLRITNGIGGTLTFGSSGSAVREIDVNSGNVDITASVHLTGGSTTISMASGASLQLANVHEDYIDTISPTSALIVVGDGTLTLSGSGLYTGGTFVDGGTVIVNSDVGFASGSSVSVGMDASMIHFAPVSAGAETPASAGGVAGAVPEPGTVALLAIGAGLIAFRASRRRKKS